MADIFAQDPNQFYQTSESSTATPIVTGIPKTDAWLATLSPEEKERAIKEIQAPTNGADIAEMMKTGRETGYVPSVEDYIKWKDHAKTLNHDTLSDIADAIPAIFEQFGRGVDAFIEHPADATVKLPASVAEAFSQQTRNLYGMIAQSQDPSSPLFRFKAVLTGDGSDIASEYQQFLDAYKFNQKSQDLAEGKTTLVMDKDLVNNDVVQAATFIADPMLFVPFAGIAGKGMSALGMGSKLAQISMRTTAIRNAIMGGGLKWGVGAPIEFLGSAVRNGIDYGIEKGAIVTEAVTGLDAKTTASYIRTSTVGSGVLSATGVYNIPYYGTVSGAYAGSSVMASAGTAARLIGEQIEKQGAYPRGILSYAERALYEAKQTGIQLSKPAENFLKVINAVDPIIGYAGDMVSGAVHGGAIGGFLGYMSGGEEGLGHGIGAGIALGSVGGFAGRAYSDISKATLYNRLATQRNFVIEGLKIKDAQKADSFARLVAKAAETGDRHYQAFIDNIITGSDRLIPDSAWIVRNEAMHEAFLVDAGIDPKTGRLSDRYSIFENLPDRRQAIKTLEVLRENGGAFAGDAAGFEAALKDGKLSKTIADGYNSLNPEQQSAFRRQLEASGKPEFRKNLNNQNLNKYYSDIHYAESLTEAIRRSPLDEAKKSAQLKDWLNQEKDSKGRITQRGRMLVEKLKAEGWADKKGNILDKQNTDIEMTSRGFQNASGFVVRRNSTGQVEININLDKMNKATVGHEMFHAVMRESVLTPDFTDRLTKGLLGSWDANGKQTQQGAASIDEIQRFFERYIREENRGDTVGQNKKLTELKAAIDEYKSRQAGNAPSRSMKVLEHYSEEFGAYYFNEWLKSKPMDYLFRGGDLTGFRAVLDSAKEGWLNYWEKKAGDANPAFDFKKEYGNKISEYFKRDGLKGRNAALDGLMADIVAGRGNSTTKAGVSVEMSGMTPQAAHNFIVSNGVSGFIRDKNGNLIREGENKNGFTKTDIERGKKTLALLDTMLQPENQHPEAPLTRTADGGLKGRLSDKQIDALVNAGIWDKANADKYRAVEALINGNDSNLVAFGYIGKDMHTGNTDFRVRGTFKNRRIIGHDVTFYAPKNGEARATMRGLDREVFDVRGNEQWANSDVRALWGDDRIRMEQDLFRVLENASKPSRNPDGSINYERKPTAHLLDNSDGKGAQRRDVIHQILGFRKNKRLAYINRPIAEIPLGIRMSLTNIRLDRATHMRVENGPRYNYNEKAALHDLSRNFMPSEMSAEETPNGKIIRHASGGKIIVDERGVATAYARTGEKLGAFAEIADAGRALHEAYNKEFDASVEGKDLPAPHTEVPPSRQAYIEIQSKSALDNVVGGKEKFLENIVVLLERINNVYENGVHNLANEIKEKILKNKDVKISDLSLIKWLGKEHFALYAFDKSRLPYYNLDYFVNLIGETHDKIVNTFGHQYDTMYPLEIKSSLADNVAQILQDYPDATAQTLKKKLLTYGSRGKRFYTEAQAIGFIKWLDSQVKPTTSPRKVFNAEGKWTGKVIQIPKGVEQTPLDHTSVMDFLEKNRMEIEVKRESGADFGKTDWITVGGERTDYKETSIKVNERYRHGVQGHYGDSVVHFRTETRLNAKGEPHKFVIEVQSQNTDGNAHKEEYLENTKTLSKLENIRKIGINKGVYVESVKESAGERRTMLEFGSENYSKSKKLNNELDNIIKEKFKDSGISESMLRSVSTNIKNELVYQTFDISYPELVTERVKSGDLKEIENVIFTSIFKSTGSFDIESVSKYMKELIGDNRLKEIVINITKMRAMENEFMQKMLKDGGVRRFDVDASGLSEKISNIRTAIEKYKLQGQESKPLTDKKETSLLALKGIIREAITDGLDTVTLTHPYDAPMASHMAPDKAVAEYSEIHPNFWASWLKRYGIELKQMNELRNPTIEKAKDNLVASQAHTAERMNKVMERFKEVMQGENPEVIKEVSAILSEPVEKFAKRFDDPSKGEYIEAHKKVNAGIIDNSLRELITDVLSSKAVDAENYIGVTRLQKQTISELHGGSVNKISKGDVAKRVSAEVLDRGMTFKITDELKRDFVRGAIDIYSMPSEGGIGGNSEGGRTYTPDQLKNKFIGKMAGKLGPDNKPLVEGVRISYTDREGLKQIIISDSDGSEIGRVSWDITNEQARRFNIKINEGFQGVGYQDILYSEALERSRYLGADNMHQAIENKKGLPLRSQTKIAGEKNTWIRDTRDEDSPKLIAPTMENFDKIFNSEEVQSRAKMGKFNPYVETYSKLDRNAWYQPAEKWTAEETSGGGVIKNAIGWTIMKTTTGKFRLYNPNKQLIGLYSDEEQAKRKAQNTR